MIHLRSTNLVFVIDYYFCPIKNKLGGVEIVSGKGAFQGLIVDTMWSLEHCLMEAPSTSCSGPGISSTNRPEHCILDLSPNCWSGWPEIVGWGSQAFWVPLGIPSLILLPPTPKMHLKEIDPSFSILGCLLELVSALMWNLCFMYYFI